MINGTDACAHSVVEKTGWAGVELEGPFVIHIRHSESAEAKHGVFRGNRQYRRNVGSPRRLQSHSFILFRFLINLFS